MLNYFMHIIPENDYFVFEVLPVGAWLYEHKKIIGKSVPYGLWKTGGGSRDKNSLYTRIFEYYANNVQNPRAGQGMTNNNLDAFFMDETIIQTRRNISKNEIFLISVSGIFIILLLYFFIRFM
jgi:hypothetical protein